jgi:hypothetical protein
MTIHSKNPFSTPDGMAIHGKLDDWMEWRKDNWAKYLATLPDEEREEVLHRKRGIARRMRSESGYISVEAEIRDCVELIVDTNPFSTSSGKPKTGENAVWLNWNKVKWKEYSGESSKNKENFDQYEKSIIDAWHATADIPLKLGPNT